MLFIACNSSKSVVTSEQIAFLDSMIQNKSFHIESDRAYPQVTSAMGSLQGSGLIPPGSNVNQMNILGIDNYLRIVGDSIKAYLPYFGERQMQINYSSDDNAIQFKGLMKDYEVEKNPKDESYTIKFKTRSNTESFRVNIKLYPNRKTDMTLYGAGRFPISYSGYVGLIEE